MNFSDSFHIGQGYILRYQLLRRILTTALLDQANNKHQNTSGGIFS